MNPMDAPQVLLFTCDSDEARAFSELLREHACVTAVCRSSDLRHALASRKYDALLCSWAFRGFGWSDVLEDLSRRNPHLPVIIIAQSTEERAWAEVLEAGAFDLLVPPHRHDSVIAVLAQAAASRQVRESRELPAAF